MTDTNRLILQGMQILINKKWVKDYAVIIEQGLITAIIPDNMIKHHQPAKTQTYPANYFLIPGLIDLHVHGANGKDVMDGDEQAFTVIAQALAQEGVTGFLATTMTASDAQIGKVLMQVPQSMPSEIGAAILGVHLEGPFIAKSKLGAQSDLYIRSPDLALFKHWQELAQNNIRLVTLAPELPDALEFIKALRKMDVILSIGHTNATYAEINAAIEAGCTQATHLFNAMRGIAQREPGASGTLLLSNDIKAELIVDGIHLHPAIVDMALRIKGKERLFLVSDAMRAKCLGDGHFELGGQDVMVNQGKATLPDGTLAGSTLRLPDAIRHFVKFTGCALEEAIALATENPARALGLHMRKGKIEVGMDADLVVMNEAFEAMVTFRGGKIIFNGQGIES